MNKYENESRRRREAVMRFLIRRAVATALLGFFTVVASPAPVHADSINSCIDRCFNTFHPPSDCPTCTGERDRCVEQCSKTAYSYGAIALGAKSKAWGTSYQWRTRAEAESKALNRCSEHGKDCKVIVWFEHSCGAVATGEVDNIFWGLGNGEGAARKNALDKCVQGGGRNCKVQVSQCSR